MIKQSGVVLICTTDDIDQIKQAKFTKKDVASTSRVSQKIDAMRGGLTK
jgi:hypothetical protein